MEVLSVVAQQILSILSALTQKLKRFIFESEEISLVHTCGVFITMNPGYAGRTELPDNLKSMFRPISMMVPDSGMIAEISLFGEGFQDTRVLARKVEQSIPISIVSLFQSTFTSGIYFVHSRPTTTEQTVPLRFRSPRNSYSNALRRQEKKTASKFTGRTSTYDSSFTFLTI